MTQPGSVDRALARLREAADRMETGWVPAGWRREFGPGPDFVPMRAGAGMQKCAVFDGLELRPGEPLGLRLELDLPEVLDGVRLRGDSLQLTINSLLPTALEVGGRQLLAETTPLVATGPAMIELLPVIEEAEVLQLGLVFHPPAHQLSPGWNMLQFTTPGTRRRFDQLDLAWARLRLAQALSAGAEDTAAVEAAAALVPLDLASAEALLGPALEAVAVPLQRFSERASALTVHVVGHTHIDLNWLWTWPNTVEVIRRDFRNILQLMQDYPEMTFTHSQPASYEVIEREEPELFEKVRDHVASGRWEAATLQWVEADSNIPSGESHARQVGEAVDYARRKLGVEPDVMLAPDTFGHAGNLPQLAAQGGATTYYHHRANPGHQADGTWPAYWWEGDDGTRLLALSTPLYGGFITASSVVEAAVNLGLDHRLPAAMLFHGVIDHGGGPTRASLECFRRLEALDGMPRLRHSTVAEFGRQLRQSGVELPVHRGESATVFEGCYTTHADTKLYNRSAENLLGTAETLSLLAGLDREAVLRPAWRRVLFNQFHDIIDGSSIHAVYDDHRVDHERVIAVATEVIDDSLDILCGEAAAGQVTVTNQLGFERQDVVVIAADQLPRSLPGVVGLRAADGTVLAGQVGDEGLVFVATVGAYSTAHFELVDAPADARPLRAEPAPDIEDASCLLVETPHFRARVRLESGVIVSLLDRRDGRQLVRLGEARWRDGADTGRSDLGLNVLQLVDEGPHHMSAWEIGSVVGETSLLRGATTRVVETGPVRVVLEVRHQFRESSALQRLVFYRELARVDSRLELDWREPGGADRGIPNLKVAFNPSLAGARCWAETPFGAAERPADGRELPCLRWVDVGDTTYGVALLNNSKYGYDALGGRLRLSLVRTAYEPDSDSDTGRHEVEFAILPHPGDWREAGVVRAARGFNQRLIGRFAGPASPTPARRHWVPSVGGSNGVCVSALKSGPGPGRTTLRLYDAHGAGGRVTIDGVPRGAGVSEVTVAGDPVGRLSPGEEGIALEFAPWQVRTLEVSDPD